MSYMSIELKIDKKSSFLTSEISKMSPQSPNIEKKVLFVFINITSI